MAFKPKKAIAPRIDGAMVTPEPSISSKQWTEFEKDYQKTDHYRFSKKQKPVKNGTKKGN